MGAFDPRWKNPPGPEPQQLYRWAQDLITELRKGAFINDASGNYAVYGLA